MSCKNTLVTSCEIIIFTVVGRRRDCTVGPLFVSVGEFEILSDPGKK